MNLLKPTVSWTTDISSKATAHIYRRLIEVYPTIYTCANFYPHADAYFCAYNNATAYINAYASISTIYSPLWRARQVFNQFSFRELELFGRNV